MTVTQRDVISFCSFLGCLAIGFTFYYVSSSISNSYITSKYEVEKCNITNVEVDNMNRKVFLIATNNDRDDNLYCQKNFDRWAKMKEWVSEVKLYDSTDCYIRNEEFYFTIEDASLFSRLISEFFCIVGSGAITLITMTVIMYMNKRKIRNENRYEELNKIE